MDDGRNTRQHRSQQGLRAQREAAGITAAYIRELSSRHARRTPQPSRRELPQPIGGCLPEGGTR
jgi:hypothetical protein